MRNKILLLLLAIAPLFVLAQHSGRVFIDTNENGMLDKGEKPLQNISVSDGLNVVKTDSKGCFTLDGHAKERFVFITTPSGYKTYNAYYQPISKNTESYDFGVIPLKSGIQKDGSHKFIHISDTEIREEHGHEEWINNLRDYSTNIDAAFIIHTGDICYPTGMESHIKIMNTRNMDLPVFYTIGNHDLVAGDYGEQLFEKLFGPVFYSFEAGNVHYIVFPMPSGDYKPSYTSEDVYNWLENDLANIKPGTPIVGFCHNVLTYGEGEFIFSAGKDKTINLDKHNMKAWLYGHWHTNHIKKHENVYSVCTSTLIRGGIDHTTSSFRVLHMDSKGDFRSELRYPFINSIEIASINLNNSAISSDGIAPISVNVYNSNSATKNVSYSVEVNTKPTNIAGNLIQNSDFNWSKDIDLSSYSDGSAVTVNVVATTYSGEVMKKKEIFVINRNDSYDITTGGNWTNLLKNSSHRGIACDTLNSDLKLKWVNNIGSNIFMASPVVYNDIVVTASIDEDLQGKASIAAFDAKSGEAKWSYKTGHSIKNSIVVEDGKVFAQDAEGYLYAIDCESGSLVWKKRLNVEKVLPLLLEGIASKDGVVYAGSGKGLTAIDAKTGNDLWVNSSWGQGEGSTSTISIAGDIIIAGVQWSALHANSAKDGKKLWSKSENGLRNRASSPAYYKGLLYMLSQSSLFVLDPKSGTVIVRKELPYSVDVTSTPLITDNEIIFGTASNGVVALNKETFDQIWNFRTKEAKIYTAPYVKSPASMIESSPVLSGNTVFVAGLDGVLYALDRKSGTLLSEYPLGAPIFTTPAISGKSLFVCDYAGNVYGFSGN